MIGIYKITNKINQHCYIGQSRQIEKRWKRHIEISNNKNIKEYQYPLYKAFRKYGIKNFLWNHWRMYCRFIKWKRKLLYQKI